MALHEAPGPRRVHVGSAYLSVGESGQLAKEPAPTSDAARAEALAAALLELQRDPAAALAALEAELKRAQAATEPIEKFVKVIDELRRGPDPATLANVSDSILGRVFRDYRASRFRHVIRVVRAALALYLLAEKWRELVALLQLDRLSAEELGDAVEATAAARDLGVLADAAGVSGLVGALLEQAGEHGAAETAGQAAGLAPQAAGHTGLAVGVKVAAAVVGALVVAGGAAGFAVGDGVWYGTGSGDEEVREGGDAEILALAVGDGSETPGSFSELTGFTPPEEVAEPGGTLDVCEPLYLYDFTHFENMAAGTDYTTTLTRGEDFSKSEAATWEDPPAFTKAFVSDHGGEPLPYGEWELVVEIDGVEVDRQTFTLEEACASD